METLGVQAQQVTAPQRALSGHPHSADVAQREEGPRSPLGWRPGPCSAHVCSAGPEQSRHEGPHTRLCRVHQVAQSWVTPCRVPKGPTELSRCWGEWRWPRGTRPDGLWTEADPGPDPPAAPLTTAALAKLHDTLGRNTAPGVGAAGARDREGVRRLGRRLPWLSGHPASPRLCAHAVPSAHGSLLAPARLSLNATLTSFGPHVLCHRWPAPGRSQASALAVPFALRVPLLPAKSRFEHPLLGNATLTSSLFPAPPPRGPHRLPGGVAPGGRPCPAAGLCEVRDVAARARPGGALLEPSPGHGDAAGMRGTLSASPPSLRKCGLAPETCSPRKALGTVLVGPAVPGFLRQNRENERERERDFSRR